MHFFIVGTSRSGSTLLRNLLALHPDIGIFNETHWAPALTQKYANRPTPFSDLIKTARQVTWDDGSNRIDGNIHDFSENPEETFRLLTELETINPVISVKTFVAKMHRLTFGKETKYLADKTPDYGHHMTDLQALWPDAKFIHIVRDGVACAQSMQRHRGCRILANSGALDWPAIACDKTYEQHDDQAKSLSFYLEHWSDKIDNIKKQSKGLRIGSYLTISYEALTQSPQATLTDIFNFLQIKWDTGTIIPQAQSFIYSTTIQHVSINEVSQLSIPVWRKIHTAKALIKPLNRLKKVSLESLSTDEKRVKLLAQIGEACRLKQFEILMEPAAQLIKLLLESEPKTSEATFGQVAAAFPNQNTLFNSLAAYLKSHTKKTWHDFTHQGVWALTTELVMEKEHFLTFFTIGLFKTTLLRPIYYVRLINMLYHLKHEAALLFYCERARKDFPREKRITSTIAQRYLDLNQVEAFNAVFNNIELDTNNTSDLVLAYRHAAFHHDAEKALAFLSKAIDTDKQNPTLYIYKANLLDNTNQTAQAEKTLLDALEQLGEKPGLLRRLTQLYQKHHHIQAMSRIASRLANASTDHSYQLPKANALIQLGDETGLTELIKGWDLNEQTLFTIKLLAKRRDIAKIQPLIDQLTEPFSELLWYYLDLDEPEEAHKLLPQLEHSLRPQHIANARWRILMKMQGVEAAMAFLNEQELAAPTDPSYKTYKMDLLIQQSRYEEVITLAATSCNALGAHDEFDRRKAVALLALEDRESTLDAIDNLNSFSCDRITVMLKAWAAYERNQAEDVPKLWATFLDNHYIPELDYQLEQLSYQSSSAINLSKGDIPLFTVLRDEMPMIPAFFSYYRKLGVTHFIVVDNDSTDGSFEWLLDQDDCYLYHTQASYKSSCYGIRWINGLMNKFAKDIWAIYVDVDEYMAMPMSCHQSIPTLIDHLEEEGAEAMTGFMLDMFSDTLGGAKTFIPGDCPLTAAPYFDDAYQQHGHWHAPFVEMYGGFRKRFVWNNEKRGNPLTKTPLVKAGKVEFLSSSHVTTPGRISKASLALLHFKFLGDVETKFSTEISRKEHACVNEEYRRYLNAIQSTSPNQSLLGTNSVRFESVTQLEKLGLITPFDIAAAQHQVKPSKAKQPAPNYDAAFYAAQYKGALTSSKKFFNHLFQCYQPESIIDFGCGIGAWLKSAGDLGVNELHGLDGDWVNQKHLLHPNINLHSVDFTQPLNLNKRYDLAMSVEVAEHFDEVHAAPFVESLCHASDVIIFGAAVPWQGGEGHVNEQMQSYWQALFNEKGFECIDYFRPKLWQDKTIDWWYRQNTFLYVQKAHPCLAAFKKKASSYKLPLDLIHPDFLYSRTFWDNHKRDPQFADKLMSYEDDKDIFGDLAIYFEHTNDDLAEFFRMKSAKNVHMLKLINKPSKTA